MIQSDEKQRLYDSILERIFFLRYTTGARSVPFERREINVAADELELARPKNLGDVVYSSRYRSSLPRSIVETADGANEWIVAPAGRSVYEFRQVRFSTVVPNPRLSQIKIPDATPGLIDLYSLGDEQALLAKLRYNRLIDIFTRLTCYSLQNHLRTSIPVWNPIRNRWDGTQVETDELYVGVGPDGAHYCIPVEAKGKNDSHNVIQMWQNTRVATSKFPDLSVRCIAAQLLDNGAIALMEVRAGNFEDLAVVREAQYALVPASEMDESDLARYRSATTHD